MSPTPTTVVLAPDSFKGTVAAGAAASAIARGWSTVRPLDEVLECPQADGGEGTMDAVAAAVPGSRLRDASTVTGPDGRPVEGRWLELPDGTAVIEMAQMSGLPLMSKLDVFGATSRGLGEVMAAAIDAGAPRLIIGLGGSASTDAGLPARVALGDRQPPEGGVILLTDVTNPLLGDRGAAAVFGPQKGARDEDIARLESRLADAVRLVGGDPAAPGSGAAGGTAFGIAAWGAEIASGSAYLSDLTTLDSLVHRADIVVTGEGRFDIQSVQGKATGRVLELAHRAGARTGVIAGSIEPDSGVSATTLLISLTEIAGSTARALDDPLSHLESAGRLMAITWDQDAGSRGPTPLRRAAMPG